MVYIAYKFDLGVEVLRLDVMSNAHILHLHLQTLHFFELLKAISPFKDALLHDSIEHTL